MNAADSLVLEFLATRAGFVANQIEHLRCWWRAVRGEGEALLSFLQRQELLSAATVQVFRQIAARNLACNLGFALIDAREIDQFRRRLPEIAVTDEDAGAPATMMLLSGQDTAHDLEAPLNGNSAAVEPPRVGAKLGKYLLTDWVGQGANGVVYRALHPTLCIPVAIKLLRCSREDREARASQFAAEARLLALLNHPNVVRLYDFERNLSQPYLVLEHVNGPSLAELIGQCGRLQPCRAVRVFRQLTDALAAAHQMGIVHRDIKPGNVLISRSGEVKLTDLGLATVVDRVGSMADSPVSGTARVGTASYVAPEIVASSNVPDARSDIYSLGATMYHAITGRPPFEGGSMWEIVERQTKTLPPSPRAIVPDLPANLADLVMRMMSRDPASRPQNTFALQQDPALNRLATSDFEACTRQHGSFWRRTMDKLGKVASIRQTRKIAQAGV